MKLLVHQVITKQQRMSSKNKNNFRIPNKCATIRCKRNFTIKKN